MHLSAHSNKSIGAQLYMYLIICVGAFITAFAIDIFLFPNRLIDGGTMGIAMILANVFGKHLFYLFVISLLVPFIYIAYKSIGRAFVIQTLFALVVFSLSSHILDTYFPYPFVEGEKLEVVCIGGALLGIGIGLIIRYGGCLDGTEILGILVNKKTGFTVGQVVLACNIFIFTSYGVISRDWHPPILSLITYMIATKVMDAVIVGLDETKSVMIISKKSRVISDAIIHELGLGLTIMYGRGGFSGEENEILYVIAERLQLPELKDIIYAEDPCAFIAIQSLYEVANGKQGYKTVKKKTRTEMIFSRIFGSSSR